jgi:hypothetical protein
MWAPVPLALGHDTTHPLRDLMPTRVKSHFSHSSLYTTPMLTCYLLWVPRRGVPKQRFATDALWEGGAARVPKRLYATNMSI